MKKLKDSMRNTSIVHSSHYTKPIFDESWWYVALKMYMEQHALLMRKLEKAAWKHQKRLFNTILEKNNINIEDNKEYTWHIQGPWVITGSLSMEKEQSLNTSLEKLTASTKRGRQKEGD